jgi:hypothetical protein
MHGKKRNAYGIFVGKPEGRRPLGRPGRRWEDTNKMNPRKMGLGGMDRFDVAQDRDEWRDFVNTVIKLWVP